jgi:hypothetical protein
MLDRAANPRTLEPPEPMEVGMRTRRMLAVSLAVLVLTPAVAAAGGRGGVGGFARRGPVVAGGGFRSHGFAHQRPSVFPIPRNPWKSWGVTRPSPGHRFHDRHTFVSPWVVPSVAAPVVAVAPSPNIVVYQEQSAPVLAQAPAPVPAAPIPMVTVVEYATGRYELRGDGLTTPYVWVWIPNPPPGPPPPEQAPPSAPPAPSGGGVQPDGERSTRVGDLYRWTDEHGVTTWTDRLSRVPERYRSQAQGAAGPK